MAEHISIWVHADGVIAFSQMIAVLRLFFSLNKFHGLPRLNEV